MCCPREEALVVASGCDRHAGEPQRRRAGARCRRHIEIGTPLLKRFGIGAISTARELCPDTPILADTKTVDAGDLEAEMVSGQGRGCHDGSFLDLGPHPRRSWKGRGALRSFCRPSTPSPSLESLGLCRTAQPFRRASPMSAFILQPTSEWPATDPPRISTQFRRYAAEASASPLPVD